MSEIIEYFCGSCGAEIKKENVRHQLGGGQSCPLCGGLQLIPVVEGKKKKCVGLEGDKDRAFTYTKPRSEEAMMRVLGEGRKPKKHKAKKKVYPVERDALSYRIDQAEAQYGFKMRMQDRSDVPLVSIKQASDYIRSEFGKGVTCRCPACGQQANLYACKINRAMVTFLGRLARMEVDSKYVCEGGYVNVRTVLGLKKNNLASATTTGANLRRWGLVHVPAAEPGCRSLGLYKVSPLGTKFLEGEYEVPSTVYMYDNVLFGVSPERVDVHGAYEEEFNYSDIMSAVDLDTILPFYISKVKKDDKQEAE